MNACGVNIDGVNYNRNVKLVLSSFLVAGIYRTSHRSLYLGGKRIFVRTFTSTHLSPQEMTLFPPCPRGRRWCRWREVLQQTRSASTAGAKGAGGEAKERGGSPQAVRALRASPAASDSPGVRGLLRAPRSAHLWCHSKEGLFFCRLLPRNLLHHHGNSLICRPRAFPLQQRNQQWRESAAGLATTASQKHTPEPSSHSTDGVYGWKQSLAGSRIHKHALKIIIISYLWTC